MKIHRGGAALSASLLVVAIAASACASSSSGGSPNNGSTPTTGANGQVSGLTRRTSIPEPTSALKQGGTVIWSLDEYATNWNYNEVDGTEASINSVQLAVMPQPFESDAQGNVTPNPDYITSVTRPRLSPQTIERKLNPNAKWSDGTPITEADYAAQCEALNGKNKALPGLQHTGYSQIKSVSGGPGGKFDVVITFSKPFADWKSLFWPSVPGEVPCRPPKLFNTRLRGRFPGDCWPVRQPGVQQVGADGHGHAVTRSWWGNKPMLSKIVFQALTLDGRQPGVRERRAQLRLRRRRRPRRLRHGQQAKDGNVTLAVGPTTGSSLSAAAQASWLTRRSARPSRWRSTGRR